MFGLIIDNVYIVSPHSQSVYNDLVEDGYATEIFNEMPTYDSILELAKLNKSKGGCILGK